MSLKKQNVAERQKESAEKFILKSLSIKSHIDVRYVQSICPGCGIHLWLYTGETILGANALGEIGKKAEIVGEEAAKNLIDEYNSGGAIDSYACDQLLPFLIFKGAKLKLVKFTEHCKTNAYIIEKFIPVKFKFDNENRLLEVIPA